MSKIEWTDRVWNPMAGCSVVSPGCTNCYAMRMAARIEKMLTDSHYSGLTKTVNGNPVWTGKIARAPDHIFHAPLKWKKPTRVFVNSMSDLFHDGVPDDTIDEIFDIMAQTQQLTYQLLTKRPDRMMRYISFNYDIPLPNVWLGVSVEDQQRADERIPLLLDTPAAVRFISAEPLLGPLDLLQRESCGDCDPCYGGRPDRCAVGSYFVGLLGGLDWVIVGGESGPGKRPVDLEWMRSIRDQCKAANVPLFVKQTDKVIPIPDDLMIREWPKTKGFEA